MNRTRLASIILAIVAITASSVALAGNALAVCADPISRNDVVVWRSLSGVEVDVHFTVKPWCRSSSYRVVAYRSRGVVDPRARQHFASPRVRLGPGEHTLNVLVTTRRHVDVIFFVDGAVYRIVGIDPTSVE